MDILSNIGIFDVIFYSLLILSFAFGILRGFSFCFFALIGIWIGFVLAWFYHQQVALVIEPFLPNLSIAKLISFIILISVGHFAGTLLKFVVGASSGNLTLISRFSGGICNLLRAFTLTFCIYLLVVGYVESLSDNLQQSAFYPLFSSFHAFVQKLVST